MSKKTEKLQETIIKIFDELSPELQELLISVGKQFAAGGGDIASPDVEVEDVVADDTPDVDDMDEDQLQEFIDEKELNVDLDDYKKLSAKRAAVTAALEAADEAGGESGDETPDVDDMDEDALGELITDKELDVDLDDFKTLKAKRKAVKEALEALDAGGDDTPDVDDMDEDALGELIDEKGLDVDLDDFKTLKAKRKAVKEALEASETTDDADGGDSSDDEAGQSWTEYKLPEIMEEFKDRAIDTALIEKFCKLKKADDKAKKTKALGKALDTADAVDLTLKKLEAMAKKMGLEMKYGRGRVGDEAKVIRAATQLVLAGAKFE